MNYMKTICEDSVLKVRTNIRKSVVFRIKKLAIEYTYHKKH